MGRLHGAGTDTRLHELYPTLTEAQLELLRRAGAEARFSDGEWVWHVGDRGRPLYAALEGAIDFLNGITVSIVHTETEDVIHVISLRKATTNEEIVLFKSLEN